MAGKNFQDMTLNEIFDFEATHSVNTGRSVVSEEGFKRHQTKLAKTVQEMRKNKKRRSAKTAVA